MTRYRSLERGVEKAGCAIVGLWIVYFAIKVITLPIFVVNLIWLVQACQHNAVGSFDFSWLIISAIGILIL